MAYTCNILLGRITKASGFEGAVTVKLERSFIGKIPQMESVYLEIDGRPVPFFISESEYRGDDSLKLCFLHYNSIDKVSEFKGCRVFLADSGKSEKDDDGLEGLLNFTVFDQDHNQAGVIREVIHNPGQVLLSIMSADRKEILIPLHEDLVISINKRKRELILKIPEGLIEIN
jgi:16S rRNA processing protein RimM